KALEARGISRAPVQLAELGRDRLADDGNRLGERAQPRLCDLLAEVALVHEGAFARLASWKARERLRDRDQRLRVMRLAIPMRGEAGGGGFGAARILARADREAMIAVARRKGAGFGIEGDRDPAGGELDAVVVAEDRKQQPVREVFAGRAPVDVEEARER